mmetsp:Transcript_26663/g.64412  ORF Transcript_26663/g.64412 Transcript_26663/m.64412 type:complete len:344 (+) Transcript_26663:2-1033(+)
MTTTTAAAAAAAAQTQHRHSCPQAPARPARPQPHPPPRTYTEGPHCRGVPSVDPAAVGAAVRVCTSRWAITTQLVQHHTRGAPTVGSLRLPQVPQTRRPHRRQWWRCRDRRHQRKVCPHRLQWSAFASHKMAGSPSDLRCSRGSSQSEEHSAPNTGDTLPPAAFAATRRVCAHQPRKAREAMIRQLRSSTRCLRRSRILTCCMPSAFHSVISPASSRFTVAAFFTSLARRPNRRVDRVSVSLTLDSLQVINMQVLAFPPMDSRRILVSLESRNGTWETRLVSAKITLPRALRLLLMNFASSNRSPLAPLFDAISDPAKSTRCNLPVSTAPDATRWATPSFITR